MTDPLRRFLGLYYGYQFFFNLLLWFPIYYEFQKRIGLNDQQIFGIQTIYYMFFCFLEIPTGYLADRWGYRPCMRLGAIVLTVANLLPVAFQSFGGLLIHFLLIGLSRSLISGASSAYLYDYLRLHGNVDDYKKVEGYARAFGLVGKVICWAGIGAMMQWQLTLPYLLTAISSAISIVFAFGLPALGIHDRSANPGFFGNIRPLASALLRSPRLPLLMLQGISIFVLARICQVNLFQPILAEKSFPLASYGLILAVNTIFEALGSAYPHLLRRWCSDLLAVSLLTLIMGISLSGIAWSGHTGTIIWLTVFSLATGLSYPIQRQLMNDAIPDPDYRATFLSLESLVDRAVCAGVVALIGGFVAAGQLDRFLHLSNLTSVGLTIAITGAMLCWGSDRLIVKKHANGTPALANRQDRRRGVGTEELL